MEKVCVSQESRVEWRRKGSGETVRETAKVEDGACFRGLGSRIFPHLHNRSGTGLDLAIRYLQLDDELTANENQHNQVNLKAARKE